MLDGPADLFFLRIPNQDVKPLPGRYAFFAEADFTADGLIDYLVYDVEDVGLPASQA